MDRTLRIIGVPMDLGQRRRGVDMGPSAVRYAGLRERLQELGFPVVDRGDVTVPFVEDRRPIRSKELVHLPNVGTVNSDIADRVEEAARAGQMPIVVGGDHSIAAGSVVGMRRVCRIGVLWVDAHGDYNTPATTPSGNLHGMPLAAIAGREPKGLAPYGGVQPVLPEEIVLVGARSLDPGEKENLKGDGIEVHTMHEVDELGMARVFRRIVSRFDRSGIDRIHVSLDLDVLDPQLAPGVGSPVPGGLSFREAHLLMELLAEDGRASSLDLVEVNPILDTRNVTAELAVGLAASLLGERIL